MRILTADIGATHARFAISDQHGSLSACRTYLTGDFSTSHSLLRRYREDVDLTELDGGCIGLAGHVREQTGCITNGVLEFAAAELAGLLGISQLTLVNDFMALASSIPYLTPAALSNLGAARTRRATKAVLGPGTGLGMAILIPRDRAWQVLPSEGGHTDFAPCNSLEREILGILQSRFGQVCWEQVLSGPGLLNLYHAVCTLWGCAPKYDSPEAVSEGAIGELDPVCHQTLEVFCASLGTAAGNLALTVCAEGGVYIGGGITGKIIEFLDASAFRERFVEKGALSSYVSSIATQAIVDSQAGLLGAAHYFLEAATDGP